MMPRCGYKRCRKVAKHLFAVDYDYEKFGEAVCLCKKHIKKLPYLESIVKRQVGNRKP